MIYKLPTRYEEFTLLVKIKTPKPEKIHLKVYDEYLKNTIFTNRWKTINGECSFFVRMPISGKSALIKIWNDRLGDKKEEDNTFEVVEIKKLPLEKRLDVLDFSNANLRSFINFCTRFCFNAGHLSSCLLYTSDAADE